MTLFRSFLIPIAAALFAFEVSAAVRKDEDNLTKAIAQARKQQVKDVSYDVELAFKKGSEEYSGLTVINVHLANKLQPLSIDFKTKRISSVNVNGTELSDYKVHKGFIDIPAKYLADSNSIKVSYVGEFSKDGDGIQRVVDPQDQTEYIYTDFEPFQAHTLIPCLDQPDLKAQFNLKITAPKGWLAIGNDLVDSAKTEGDTTITTFKTTPKISTYLFFVGAGQFELWKASAGTIPLELYARKSLKKYVDVERIFDSTKKGLAFYEEYFGVKYPFSKFGQIFVPEFAWGGMENPGAVTLNERNIYRGTPTKKNLDDRNSLILHEMAHMWFGDLVTMNWWNDLWLNESFASYLATVAQARALNASGAWLDFHSDKGWAYWQDQLSTTHPIETEVLDVRSAKANFDGITYAKGASSLKQLHFYVGEDGFKKGLQDYFKTFAFKNTSRADFIGAIGRASDKNLTQWTKAWLQTAGPHRTKVAWQCSNSGTISKFVLTQQPNASKVLSPHKTKIAFYKKNSQGKFEAIKELEVPFEKRETMVADAVGVSCPDFVYANYDDQDYGLYSLDPVSLKSATQVIQGGLDHTLTRLMVWSTLNQMVRDTQLRVSDYFNMAMSGLEAEKDSEVISILLGSYSSLRDVYFHYLTKEQRINLAPQFEKLVWSKVQSTEVPPLLKMVYFDFYTSIAFSDDSVNRLAAILNGKLKVDGVDMDQDRRWTIVNSLARLNAPNVASIIEAEEKRDPTTAGKRSAYAARVGIPTPEAKATFWKSLENPKDIPHSTLRAASNSFNNFDRPELTEGYVKPFFKQVMSVSWDNSENDNLVDIYFERLFPQSLCSKNLLTESRKNLGTAKNLTPFARRSWVEANDELGKCVAIRAADKTPLKESP